MDALQLDNVTKVFGDTRAVDGVSLKIPAGTIYGLLGPNGAGKTTTIRMIVDIMRPDSGSIEVLGGAAGLDIQHRVGYLPEERGLYRKMKVLEQLVFLAELKRIRVRDAKRIAMEYLEKFELAEWADKKVEQLSKGMQQKIQFIGTILHNPDLLILDEPFSGLDPINQALLKEEIQNFLDRGKTVIFSTHVLSQAEQLCHDICMINRGKKVLDGSIEAIKKEFSERLFLLDTSADIEDLACEGSEVTANGNHVEVRFDEGTTPEFYLSKILGRGVPITSFGPKITDLESIFIKVVEDDIQ